MNVHGAIFVERIASSNEINNAFTFIFDFNGFGGNESISGPGSSIYETTYIRMQLPRIFHDYAIKILLDLPCGDFNWMRLVDLSALDQYIGSDIVATLVEKNQKQYGNERITFSQKDIVYDALPTADLLLCRDCFVHLPFDLIFQALANIKKAGIPYILITTFPAQDANTDIHSIGQWRALNFQKTPFNFPPPIECIAEHYCASRKDKSLGLWRVADLPL